MKKLKKDCSKAIKSVEQGHDAGLSHGPANDMENQIFLEAILTDENGKAGMIESYMQHIYGRSMQTYQTGWFVH